MAPCRGRAPGVRLGRGPPARPPAASRGPPGHPDIRGITHAIGDHPDRPGAEGLRRARRALRRPQPRRPRAPPDRQGGPGPRSRRGPARRPRPCPGGPGSTAWITPGSCCPVPDPAKIVCLGLNYRDHAAESGMEPPTEPILFSKYATTLIGPGAPIVLPPPATRSTTRPSWSSSSAGAGATSPGSGDGARRRLLRSATTSRRATGSSASRASSGWPARPSTPSPRSARRRHRRRGARPPRPRDPAPPQRPDDAGFEHRRADLPGRRDRRLLLDDLHPGAGRPDLHRDPARRRDGPETAGLARPTATASRFRSKGWGPWPTRWSAADRPGRVSAPNSDDLRFTPGGSRIIVPPVRFGPLSMDPTRPRSAPDRPRSIAGGRKEVRHTP